MSKDLSQLERLDPSLRQTLESVDALTHEVEELAHALRSYRDGIEYSRPVFKSLRSVWT